MDKQEQEACELGEFWEFGGGDRMIIKHDKNKNDLNPNKITFEVASKI